MKIKLIALAMAGLILHGNLNGQDSNTAASGKSYPYHLIVLDPGHFHAALIQKNMYENVDPEVHVYAPKGPDLEAYLTLVEKYNNRALSPTHWIPRVYAGDDYLEKMLSDKAGNVLVVAGNNQKKSLYIHKAIDAGINVLADKPMLIDPKKFDELEETFSTAAKKGVILFDIMTERYDITNTLQKELAQSQEIFGQLKKGTLRDPAIVEEGVHYFLKFVSGSPLIRPAWFYDIHQQGDGLADITTHLVDIIEWKYFSGQDLNYKKDIQMDLSKRWPTKLTPAQFYQSTNTKPYPGYLSYAVKDSVLNVFSNGEMNYSIKGVHAKVSVDWKLEAEEGAGDSHYSLLRGTKANLVIRQDKSTQFHPVLYIEPLTEGQESYAGQLEHFFSDRLEKKYPGVKPEKTDKGWKVVIPEKYNIGHEEQFAMVARQFMQYLKKGRLPQRETDYMLTKYYTIAEALKKANSFY